jgi:hypothetical protein
MKETILNFLALIKKLFWTSPVKTEKQKNEKLPAADVAHAYVIIYYKGKPIQLEKRQVAYFNSLDAKTKKMWVDAFNANIKKGRLVLKEIDGKKVYVKGRGFDHKKHFTK